MPLQDNQSSNEPRLWVGIMPDADSDISEPLVWGRHTYSSHQLASSSEGEKELALLPALVADLKPGPLSNNYYLAAPHQLTILICQEDVWW